MDLRTPCIIRDFTESLLDWENPWSSWFLVTTSRPRIWLYLNLRLQEWKQSLFLYKEKICKSPKRKRIHLRVEMFHAAETCVALSFVKVGKFVGFGRPYGGGRRLYTAPSVFHSVSPGMLTSRENSFQRIQVRRSMILNGPFKSIDKMDRCIDFNTRGTSRSKRT